MATCHRRVRTFHRESWPGERVACMAPRSPPRRPIGVNHSLSQLIEIPGLSTPPRARRRTRSQFESTDRNPRSLHTTPSPSSNSSSNSASSSRVCAERSIGLGGPARRCSSSSMTSASSSGGNETMWMWPPFQIRGVPTPSWSSYSTHRCRRARVRRLLRTVQSALVLDHVCL
jgi:hypothetical protein